jgi:hypothetical protein
MGVRPSKCGHGALVPKSGPSGAGLFKGGPVGCFPPLIPLSRLGTVLGDPEQQVRQDAHKPAGGETRVKLYDDITARVVAEME